MSAATEERTLLSTLQRVEEIEQVADRLREIDPAGRDALQRVVAETLTAVPPMRPSVAAKILGLSEKTVRTWASEGVLRPVAGKTVKVDARRLHEVLHLVHELRDAGQTRGLLDAVHRRLVDEAVLNRADLAESLEQMRRGEGRVLVPLPDTGDAASGSAGA